MECSVCMNYYEDDFYSTYCGHLFCKLCANQMTAKSAKCWTCQSPIVSSQIHKIYLPEASRRVNRSHSVSGGDLTKEEILKTMLADLEIECERNAKKYKELKESVDVYAMSYAHFVSLNDELKRKNEILERKLLLIQEKLNRCEQIVDEYDKKAVNTRPKRSARSTKKMGA